MKKTRLLWIYVLVLVFAMTSQTSFHAQGRGPAAAAAAKPAPGNIPGAAFTFVPKADLQAVMGPQKADQPARVVSAGPGGNLGEYILHYPPVKGTLPADTFYHTEVSEL